MGKEPLDQTQILKSIGETYVLRVQLSRSDPITILEVRAYGLINYSEKNLRYYLGV